MMMIRVICVCLMASCVTGMLPTIYKEPANVTVNAGEDAEFNCKGSGSPTPQIIIVREDSMSRRATDDNEAESTDDTSNISIYRTIHDVTVSDEGWYVCVVSNIFGTVKSRAYLHVRDVCENVKCPRKQHCHANSETGLGECRCKACSDTRHKPVCDSNCKTYFNSCAFKQETCTESKYVRIAKNGECEDTVVETPQTNYDIFDGDALILSCKVTGTPKPSVRWVKKTKSGKQRIVSYDAEYIVQSVSKFNSGTYQCIAKQCDSKTKSELVEVTVSSNIADDPVPTGNTCKVFGDPHMVSYDGHKYDYQGKCNYILSMDCYDVSWILMGRFMPCGEGVTCMEDITLYYGATNLMMTRGWIVGQNGVKNRLRKNKEVDIGELKVKYTGLSVDVSLPNGVKIVYDGFWGIQITAPTGLRTCGLCGDNNGNSTDDLMKGRFDTGDHDITTFAESWKLGGSDWCKADDTAEDAACVAEEDTKAICDELISSPVFATCLEDLGVDYYRGVCEHDVCLADVQRFNGENKCAFASTMAQHCQVAGHSIEEDFMAQLECDERALQEDIYNSGCPLQGNPPYLDE